MDSLKTCSLCGCGSNETAIMTCSYAKGDLHVCLECLTEGVLEVVKEIETSKSKAQDKLKHAVIEPLPEFAYTVPDEVFGFNCEECGSVMFTGTFPITCECGFTNNEVVIKKQDLLNYRK